MPYTPSLANIRARVRMIAKFEQVFKYPIVDLYLQDGCAIALYQTGTRATIQKRMTDEELLDYKNYLVAKIRNTDDELKVFDGEKSLENRLRRWQSDFDRLHRVIKDIREHEHVSLISEG